MDRVALSGNQLTAPNTQGGAIWNNSGSLLINNSCIVNNSNVSLKNVDGDTLDASRNWWGQAPGPGPVGSTSSVEGSVNTSNFLTSAPSIPGCSGT